MTAPSLVEEVSEAICPDESGTHYVADLAHAAIAVILRRMEGGPSSKMYEAMLMAPCNLQDMWRAGLAAFRKENGLE